MQGQVWYEEHKVALIVIAVGIGPAIIGEFSTQTIHKSTIYRPTTVLKAFYGSRMKI